jgi:choline dehydrogenase
MHHREMYHPRGKVLGGSSSINAMIYIRGHRADYDAWARLGNTGWSYEQVLPYFKRSEQNLNLTDHFHGTRGELVVSNPNYTHPLVRAMVKSAESAGLRYNPDFNGADPIGIGYYQVNQKNGRRWSGARAFLDKAVKDRPNLDIWTSTPAHKILLEGHEVKGLRVRRGGALLDLEVEKELILAAGAFGSPQLLMLSGIGEPRELREYGIPVVHVLPGVGKNLQDHLLCGIGVHTDYKPTLDHAETFPYVLRNLWSYFFQAKGMLTSNVAEFGGFAATLDGLEAPDIQFHGAASHFVRHGFDNPKGKGGFSLGATLIKPGSRGTISLQSPDPEAKPRIDPHYFSDPEDLETMIRGIQLVERILEQPPLAKWIKRRFVPEKRLEDREAIADFLRTRAETLYHPVGTCKMGMDAWAVVDPELRVHGLSGLRVADASIMPEIIRGNTNAPTYMIAEKAAEWIVYGRQVVAERAGQAS